MLRPSGEHIAKNAAMGPRVRHSGSSAVRASTSPQEKR
jgi:hypothetical protein